MLERIPWLAGLLLVACGSPGASGPQAVADTDPLREWVVAETERLGESTGALGDDGDRVASELAAIAADAEAGRALYAASQLTSPRQRIEARLYRRDRLSAVTDLDSLEAEAGELTGELERIENLLDAELSKRPAAFRGLADEARVHAHAYHGAAVAYGRVASLASGLYYLGAARSLLGTAADLAALPVQAPQGDGPGPPSAATFEAELAELDRRAIAAYRAPGAEIDRHADFIALNAEIKEARDLLAAGRVDGALLATLDARRQLEEILADGTGPEPGELRRRAAGFRDRCRAADWDASVGRLLIETAEDALAADAPRPEAVRRARAVLLHVMPRYFELHEETR